MEEPVGFVVKLKAELERLQKEIMCVIWYSTSSCQLVFFFLFFTFLLAAAERS